MAASEEVCVAIITDAIHYRIGGFEIDVNTSCMSGDGKMVKGLYMVGDVAGAAHERGQAWQLALGLRSSGLNSL